MLIRLTLHHATMYSGCIVRGKENGVNILKSIDEGPFHLGTFRETLAKENEGALHLGPERARVYSDLSPEDKERYNADIRETKYPTIKGYMARNYTQPKLPQNSEYFKDKMLLMQAQENGVKLEEEQLLFIASGQDNIVDEDVDEQPVQDLALNVDNVFQAADCDAFDFDADEAPTTHTMFMSNLSSADPVYDEASPSYDSNILSKVPDYDNYQDVVCEYHEVHEMHHDVQPNYVVDSHADYTNDSNMIMYAQYVKDNGVPVVQSNVSSIPNGDYIMIINEMHEQTAPSVFANQQNKVVNASLTVELVTYQEQIELYER
ncbi:hypothetical protein Tco_0631119 [Tanacetum coccineum]